MILDATCAPGDIRYPQDLGLLNQARVQTEKIIDTLYEPLKGKLENKPKTYRNLARKNYLPIVRGKAGTPVEFGAKLSVSLRDGYVFLDRIDWNNFNESGDLKAQVEAFKQSTGRYPESVHVDRIYRTRENRAFCKERGIRISDPPLGRPPAYVSAEQKRQALEDERIRNRIEGKFGVSKRRFSLNRVMAKLPHTSQTAIAITFLVVNLSTLLRQVFLSFFGLSTLFMPGLESMINSGYDWGIFNKNSSSLLEAYITN